MTDLVLTGGEAPGWAAGGRTVRLARAAVRLAPLTPLVVQLVVLHVRAQRQWDRFNLSLDFSIFHQAWHQIGAGDLSPDITAFGYPYWRSHFELVMWLMAPLRVVFRDGAFLLHAQALATVAAQGVALWWAGEMLRRRFPGRGAAVPVVVGAAAVLGALNPWVYTASAQDVHLEAFGVLFAVLAARDFWLGRLRRGWLWATLSLAAGDVSGIYVAGLGLSVLLSERGRWRLGLALVGAGAGWIAFVDLLGASHASGISSYAWVYDPGAAGGGALSVLAGLATHPGSVLSVLSDRSGLLWRSFIPVGGVGAFAPWTAGPVLLVLAVNALHPNVYFSGPTFQNLPIYVFGLAGTALAVGWLALRLPPRAAWPVTAALLAGAALPAAHLAVTRTEPISLYQVDAATAADLAAVARQVPGDAEVVVSFGVAGRFAARRHQYIHTFSGQAVPLAEETVAFVFAPAAGNQGLPRAEVEGVARAVRDRLGARVLADGPRVYAYLWSRGGDGSAPDGRPLTLVPDLRWPGP